MGWLIGWLVIASIVGIAYRGVWHETARLGRLAEQIVLFAGFFGSGGGVVVVVVVVVVAVFVSFWLLLLLL